MAVKRVTEQKPPLHFRAVKKGGSYSTQFSATGEVWYGSVDGLDEAAVQAQFQKLKAHGCVIEDTKDFTMKKEVKK